MKANKSGESGNFVVLAESQEELGCGKTAIGVEVVRVFLAHADVSQLKEQYSGKAGTDFIGAVPTHVCRDTVLTNAEGYAAHIDGSLRVLQALWVLFAVLFAGMAFIIGHRPYVCLSARPSSLAASTSAKGDHPGGSHE
ncbi:conjugal transfer protein TraP [Symbiopectobacterium purcellii]|uniref:conjugal transfer protein TraP n=1 Tax=Symbiopectobacterium purcellii TaxID=2871826 RepID=UPI003F8528C6